MALWVYLIGCFAASHRAARQGFRASVAPLVSAQIARVPIRTQLHVLSVARAHVRPEQTADVWRVAQSCPKR
jgi:hypothetical protein